MTPQEASDKCIKLLIDVEGKESYEYLDDKGLPTIGCGHLLSVVELGTRTVIINGEPVEFDKGLSGEQIYHLLMQDLYSAVQTVNRLVNVILTQNQFDCLCSFCFNIGNTKFANSTLVKLLNRSNYEAVPEQLRRWNKKTLPSGEVVVSKGATRRREKEVKMWLGTPS
jgi:lysozyme